MAHAGQRSSWTCRAFFTIAIAIGLALVAVRAADQSVVWTNMTNVAVAGDVLQKVSGCDGCEDAGATSQQTVASGDGYVEFTVGESNTLWAAGLSSGNTDATYADI